MAGKRVATDDLNHENWNKDDQPEEAGSFQRASDEMLKTRVIKTARRRNPISSVRTSGPDKTGVFSGFTAFSKTPTPTSNAFSFLSNLTTPSEQSKINGFSVDNSTKPVSKTSITPTISDSNAVNTKTQDYYSKLKGLNESVSKWIKQHVDANPLINLHPIFRDYEKYFKEIESEKESAEAKAIYSNKKDETTVSSMSNFVFKSAENIPDSTTEKTQDGGKNEPNKIPTVGFETNATSTPQTKLPTFSFGNNTSLGTSNKLSFGATSNATTISGPATFSFGSTASTVSNFSFSNSTPFSFSAATNAASSENESNEHDDEKGEAIPEEPQLSKVVESDHIYTTRCKVFIKKNSQYAVHGVGDLYIKPIENSEKVQVIVRADNNLGTLLCNFVLSKSIPTTKKGPKDVMLICLMTPDVKPPPVPIIIRVKTAEEADKLLDILEKHKK